METENPTPQIPSQPTPSVHFSKAVVILGIALASAFVVGAVFYFKNLKPMNKEQSHSVIYGERYKSLNDDINNDNGSMVVYSVNSSTKIQRELFNVTVRDYDSLRNIKFCGATNKIYIYLYGEKDGDLFIKEIDLKGNVRKLDFTGTIIPEYKIFEEVMGDGFILSKDCQKIVFDISYHDRYGGRNVIDEITFADINGGGKRVLQTSKPVSGELEKDLYSWSVTDHNIVYLTNYYSKNNHWGGLYKFELNTNSRYQINAIPTEDIIMDISNNDKLIAHRLESVYPKSFVTNLANNSTVPINIGTKEIKASKFSPDNFKLAYTALDYKSSNQFDCPLNLYIFDPVKKTDKLVTRIANICSRTIDVDILKKNSNFIDWLTNDTVIYVKDGKDLATVNVNDGKETKLAPVSGELLFVGVSDK